MSTISTSSGTRSAWKRSSSGAVVGLAIGEVAREPDPEGLAGKKRGRARERTQVRQPARVVASVAEHVSVLVGAAVRRPRAAKPGAASWSSTVWLSSSRYQPAAGEQAVVQLDRPACEVEGAVPAAQVAGGGGAEAGLLADGVGGDLQRRRSRAGRRRGWEARMGSGAAGQGQRQVVRPQRARPAAIGEAEPPRADRERVAGSADPVSGRAQTAVHHVERRPVLEAAVGRVLDADQRRGDHLEARVALDHRAGARGHGRLGEHEARQRRGHEPAPPPGAFHPALVAGISPRRPRSRGPWCRRPRQRPRSRRPA